MKIGMNAYEANVPHRVGSNAFAYYVLLELEKRTRNTEDEVTVYLPSAPLSDMPKERKGWTYRIIPPAKLWTIWRLPFELCKDLIQGKRFHVFYSLGHYAPRWCPFPSVVSIMDVAYLKFPSFFKKSDVWKLKHWTAYSVQAAKHMITISQYSKKDIMHYYHRKSEDITVAYPGIQPQQLPSSSRLLHTHRISSSYIVYVGTIQPRKNLVRLVKAFEKLATKKEYSHLDLVIAGKIGWLADEFTKTVQQSPVRKRIHVIGFVTDEQKQELYAHATAAVLIGLYEGFGIPPLEAMQAGTIPVVSNTASLPEVVGNAGILVNPYHVDDIARGLETVLKYTKEERELMKKWGQEQLEKFSWEQTGQIILDVLHRVGQKGREKGGR